MNFDKHLVDKITALEERIADLERLGTVRTRWQSYTVAWTASTTNPAIVDGTLLGYYQRMGKSTRAIITMIAGASTTFGSGNWAFSLPFTTYASVPNVNLYWLGLFTIRDASPVAYYNGVARINRNQTVLNTFFITAGGATLTATAPITWAASDQLFIDISYEVA